MTSVNEASAVLRAAVRDTIRRRRFLFLIQGGVMVATGAVAVIAPLFGSTGLIALLGWLLVASAVAQIVGLIGSTQVPYFWLQFVAVTLGLLVGYLLITNPAGGLVTATVLMLALFLVDGITQIVFSLMVRPMRDWLYLLASGVLAIGCAALLFGRLPEAPGTLLGLLLGVELAVLGGAQGLVAWRARGVA